MLSFIQKIFGSSKNRVKVTNGAGARPLDAGVAPLSVEVAHLRLAAILQRFPEEVKPLILKMPEDTVTFALPVAILVKQLASGGVKVSLATLHRYAPAGVFGPLPPGDRRMVEVPLAEVFRHLGPTAFKRRSDQRPAAGLDSDFNLFGDAANPHQIAPTAPQEAAVTIPSAGAPALKLPEKSFEHTTGAPVDLAADFVPELLPAPLPARVITAPPEIHGLRLVRTPAPEASVEFSVAPEVNSREGDSVPATIAYSVQSLSESWPASIREELAALNGSARLHLPAAEVTAGLARGRVTFPWGRIREWIEPRPGGESSTDGAAELVLPLKVVAPAFLAATKGARPLARTQSEPDIPSLFNDRRTATVASPATESSVRTEAAAAGAEAAPAPVTAPVPASLGSLFGQPDKPEWTPAELVSHLAGLPGISGAVVALQEGLLVAHSLPADVKSEVIAAFLPQLFARLNQYAGEMRLGEVDDLLFTTHGAHCQIYRLGYVYFAVLGKPGEPLPWPALRLVVDELARQTKQKS